MTMYTYIIIYIYIYIQFICTVGIYLYRLYLIYHNLVMYEEWYVCQCTIYML